MYKLLLVNLCICSCLYSQGGPASHAKPVTSLPSRCSVKGGDIVALTTGINAGLYSCGPTDNNWIYSGSGAVGPAGPTGATGATGPAGPAGATGASGLTSGTLASIPATCTAGVSLYQATDQPIPLQIYACTSTNTWTRQSYTQGTSNPATCTIGQIFFNSTSTAGQNLWLCTSTNTWTQLTGTGGGTANPANVISVAYSPTAALNCTSATAGTITRFDVGTLTGNITFTSTGCTPGQLAVVNLTQDAVGGWTVTWPAGWEAQTVTPYATFSSRLAFLITSGGAIAATGANGGPLLFGSEQADPGVTPAAGTFYCWADSTAHNGLQCRANGSNTILSIRPPLSWGAVFDGGGSAISTSAIGYFTVLYSCTINGYDIETVGTSGTTTFKFARVAAGSGSNPTIGANSINTSGLSVTTAAPVGSTTVTDFTSTAIAAGDILAVQPITVTGTTWARVSFRCN